MSTPTPERSRPAPGDPAAAGQQARRGSLSNRHHLGIVAAAATLLATAPLLVLFERWTWLLQCTVAVAAVAAVAAGSRSLRAPVWLQTLAMAAALLFALTWLFRSGEELLLLPTPGTLEHFGALLGEVPQVVANETLPVGDRQGLLLLTVLGVGVVAILVDLIAVGLRRPALAGLPMLAVYSVPVAVSQQSVHAATFMIGVVGYLWLVATDNLDRVRRFGRRFTGDGRDVQVWEPSPLAAAGRRLTVIGALIAVALPLAVPGMTTGLVDRFGSGFGGEGGTGPGGDQTAVNLFAQLDGLLNRDNTVELLELTTDDPDPFYLRVGTAERITEDGFDHRPPTGQSVTEGIPAVPSPRGVTDHRHRADVEIINWDMNRLPTFSRLTGLGGVDDVWRYDDDQQVVFSEDTRATGLSYEFQFVRREFDPSALAGSRPLPEDDPVSRRFGEVIEEPQVDQLVSDLTAGADNPYDQVRRILAHFSTSNGFRYSLETGSKTTGSAIVDFLFEHQSGYCVQYAAAMAWMVRAADLPSRVAIGFTRGRQQVSGTYVLTNHNLHAWTEVYFDGFGWVPFDPTPSTSVAGSAPRDWSPDPNAPPDLGSPGDNPDPGATPLPPGDGPDEGPELAPEPGGAVGGLPGDSRSLWPLWLLAAAAVLLALLAAPALHRVRLRRRRIPHRLSQVGPAAPAAVGEPVVTSGDPAPEARHWANSAWDELLDTMVDYQVPLRAAETPRMTTERLVRECRLDAAGGPTPAGEGARLLGRAEERARYARAPGSPAGLAAATHAVRRGLAGQAGRATRVRAVLLPRSTLLRWRAVVSDALGRVSAGASWLGTAVAQLSPRRLLRSS